MSVQAVTKSSQELLHRSDELSQCKTPEYQVSLHPSNAMVRKIVPEYLDYSDIVVLANLNKAWRGDHFWEIQNARKKALIKAVRLYRIPKEMRAMFEASGTPIEKMTAFHIRFDPSGQFRNDRNIDWVRPDQMTHSVMRIEDDYRDRPGVIMKTQVRPHAVFISRFLGNLHRVLYDYPTGNLTFNVGRFRRLLRNCMKKGEIVSAHYQRYSTEDRFLHQASHLSTGWTGSAPGNDKEISTVLNGKDPVIFLPGHPNEKGTVAALASRCFSSR
jgi:hypothetical protein